VIVNDLLMSIGDVITFGLLFTTLIPSYKLWVHLFGNPSSVWVAVPVLACAALMLQTVSWTVVLAIFQFSPFGGQRKTQSH